MSYQEWRRQQWGFAPTVDTRFWAIIDYVWLPAEQSELARLWKAWAPE